MPRTVLSASWALSKSTKCRQWTLNTKGVFRISVSGFLIKQYKKDKHSRQGCTGERRQWVRLSIIVTVFTFFSFWGEIYKGECRLACQSLWVWESASTVPSPQRGKSQRAIHVSAPFVSNWFLGRDEVTTRKMSVINYFHSSHSNYLNGLPFT